MTEIESVANIRMAGTEALASEKIPRSISVRVWLIGLITFISLVCVIGAMFWAEVATERSEESSNAVNELEAFPLLQVAAGAYKAEIAVAGTLFGPEEARPFTMAAYRTEVRAVETLIANLLEVSELQAELDDVERGIDHWQVALAEVELSIELDDPVEDSAHVLLALNALNATANSFEKASAVSRQEARDGMAHAALVRDRAEIFAITVALLGLLIAGYLVNRLTRDLVLPLRSLQLSASRIADGEEHHLVEIDSPREMKEVGNSFNEMASRLRARQDSLTHLAYHDPLTGLGNREAMHQHLSSAVARLRRRQGEAVALILIDLDRFKDLNDALGHSAGDMALIETSQRIAECLRLTDTVCRLSGDEFCVISEGADQGSPRLAQRVIDAISQPFEVAGQSVLLEGSAGVVFAISGTENNEDLIRDADLAMYSAKAKGRNTVEVFDSTLLDDAKHRHQIATELREGLERDEFEVHYQPVIDLEAQKVVGCEALIRWQHPTRGLLAPAEFLDIAEDCGLIVPIGEHVLDVALKDLTRWNGCLGESSGFRVSVNVSAHQIKLPDFAKGIEEALTQNGCEATQLCLELTETALLEQSNDVYSKLEQLRGSGICIALDDFGTGFSSLHLVKTMHVDVIKIDRSFVDGISHKPELKALVRSVLELADAFDRAVVVEGIETEEDAETIRLLGGSIGQGYLFGRAVPAGDFEQLLVENLASSRANN